jgi:Fe(3+) dicitrate transport protein
MPDRVSSKTSMKPIPLLCCALAPVIAYSQSPAPAGAEPVVLDTIVVSASVPGQFLPDLSNGKIYAGKKTSVIDLGDLPALQTDNYRQAFIKTPGLLISEVANNSILNVGSRGLGDPHESQNILVMRDGLSYALDPHGYPAVYNAPAFEAMQRLDYIRGGAALLYGPQPGGALNFVSRRPVLDREFQGSTQHVFGSGNLYSQFSTIEGTTGRLSYLVNYNHRSGDGLRDAGRSAFEFNGGNIMLGLDLDSDTRWLLDVDTFSSDANEPGGLAMQNFLQDRTQPLLFGDQLRVRRTFATLTLEHDFSPSTQVIAKVFGGLANRTSHRQNGVGFGAVDPEVRSNITNEQRFHSLGADVRLSHGWTAWEEEHNLTAGFTASYTDAPICNRFGRDFTSRGGALYHDISRDTTYLAMFIENQFKFGRLSVIPGLRFENIRQRISDNLRRDAQPPFAPLPLRSLEDTESVSLGAIALAYDLTDASSAYFNLSQGYKPPMFADLLPVQSNVINGDLDAGSTVTYELGWRGRKASLLSWDVSGFFIDYQDRFGTVGSGGSQFITNVGRSQNWGVDFAGEMDLIAWAAKRGGGDPAAATKRMGNLALHVAYEWLNAEFVEGPNTGRTPQYAPEHLLRLGLSYSLRERFKVSLLHTRVGRHFGNDNNTADFAIPAYNVTDLLFEAKVWKDHLTALAGINNLFDEDYFSRVRANGIEPAWGRNFYAGFRITF